MRAAASSERDPKMAYTEILTEVREHTMVITLNRPDHMNAFTVTMANELVAAFADAGQNDDVRAVILTGGGRAFCAGADLSEGAEALASGPSKSAEDHRDHGGIVTLAMFECPKPIIAAINGSAVGIGITMTLAADVRFMVPQAKIGFVFLARGIAPDAASTWFLPRVVGISKATEWFSTARILTPQDCLEAGLVSELIDTDELMDRAFALSDEIAANTSAVSVAIGRRLLWDMLGADHPLEAHLRESKALFHMAKSADALEGVTSFFEKRPADFPMNVSTDLPDF